MSIKLLIPELQKKAFFLETSNGNMRKTLQYQLDQAKAQDLENKTMEEQLEQSLGLLDATNSYIVSILKLTEAQKTKLDDLSVEDTSMLATRITLRLQGLTEKEVKDALSPDDDESEDEDEESK